MSFQSQLARVGSIHNRSQAAEAITVQKKPIPIVVQTVREMMGSLTLIILTAIAAASMRTIPAIVEPA